MWNDGAIAPGNAVPLDEGLSKNNTKPRPLRLGHNWISHLAEEGRIGRKGFTYHFGILVAMSPTES
jgi:hypothetical protein